MTTKFEQLIEYVINDEEAKAKELFHDIVVEKSREIYENLMNEEECDDEEELDEAAEEEAEEDAEELDEAAEEDLDEDFGGDAADNLMQDVETEEEGIAMEDGDEEVEFGAEEETEEGGEDLEDRVVDLEDKLDELMAEFESMMDDDGVESDLAGEEGDEVEGDALAADDTMSFDSEEETLDENVNLSPAPKPVTSEPAGTNTKSTTAFNSGAAGMAASPVKTTGAEAKGRPAPTAGKISSDKFQNEPATGSKKLSPATKPTLTQAAGVNNKTPFPKG